MNIKIIWQDTINYASEKWNVIAGFTEIPESFVLAGKTIPYKYAMICIMEMDKAKIDLAPGREAGDEVQRVYDRLGVAVEDIARWLREHGVTCQSEAPRGGSANTVPLAVKAGLGRLGMNGLVISPRWGPRFRIAPVYIKDKIFEFTDTCSNQWIETFCDGCRICESACPAGAILHDKKLKTVNDRNTVYTCIESEKCRMVFKETFGCGVCIKVCPLQN